MRGRYGGGGGEGGACNSYRYEYIICRYMNWKLLSWEIGLCDINTDLCYLHALWGGGGPGG